VSRRRRVGTALGIAALFAATCAVGGLPGAYADDAVTVLERARTATVREDFAGTVQIEWLDDGGWRSARTKVTGAGGAVQVGEGARQAGGRAEDRWIAGVTGWKVGWDEPVARAAPSPATRWDLTMATGTPVAGRATVMVTASDPKTGAPRVRAYCDKATGVMLRREILDRQGRVVRAVGFVEVARLGGATAVPPTTPQAAERRPSARGADPTPDAVRALPAGVAAPDRVTGFVLAGRYERSDGTVQLYYSDGLFGVSVFQQVGVLDPGGMPVADDRTRVSDTAALGYEVAGGSVLVWERDGVTRTLVSDATVADLRDFAVAFDDRAADGRGLVDRVADFLFGPFGWR
jgi:sigma-E factor negative regulatory protein RseB